MKKILAAVLSGVCMMLVAATSHANVFTLDLNSLNSFGQISGGKTLGSDFKKSLSASGKEIVFDLDKVNDITPAQVITVGEQFNSNHLLDLSQYSQGKYGLFFENLNDSRWDINLYIASNGVGYSDTNLVSLYPYSHTASGPYTGSLFMDLSAAANAGVHLDQVTAIGFQVRAHSFYNSQVQKSNPDYDPGEGGDCPRIGVSPVPEPSSMMLIGGGLLGLLGFARRKRS